MPPRCALVAGAQDSPDVGRVVQRFRTVRLAQVGPIVERAVTRGQLPQGTNPDDLMLGRAAIPPATRHRRAIDLGTAD